MNEFFYQVQEEEEGVLEVVPKDCHACLFLARAVCSEKVG